MTDRYQALRASPTFAEESFVTDTQSFLQTIMEEKGINQTQLAEAMGVSKARVSQMFSSEVKNFTIRLLARAVHALGDRVEITSSTYREVEQRRHRETTREVAARGEHIAMCSGWEMKPSRRAAADAEQVSQSPTRAVLSAMRKFESQAAA
jgi:transcriptional regulator with XRE-family HTH domain